MQGLQLAESIAGGGIDTISGTTSSIIFSGTGVDHIRSPRGYMSPATPPNQPPLKCPRCDSSNTKFCYYNNYNLSQPRHFCKACRRYWTKGGVLRNVPVGGGCRKTKRASNSNSSKPLKKNCKRTASSQSTSDTSTVTSVEPSNTDSGLIVAETCCTELPSQLIAPSMRDHDLQCSFPNLITSHISNELKEDEDKTKLDDDPALLSVFDQTAPDAHLLPAFQVQFGSDGVLAFPGLDWSLPVDHSFIDLHTGAVDTGSIWNQNNWGDAAADPALYLP